MRALRGSGSACCAMLCMDAELDARLSSPEWAAACSLSSSSCTSAALLIKALICSCICKVANAQTKYDALSMKEPVNRSSLHWTGNLAWADEKRAALPQKL